MKPHPPESYPGYFALPVPPPDESNPSSDRSTSAAGERESARILVVEDDFLIAMQTEEALTAAGMHVIGVASTAEEAVALASATHPFLAVMDIRLAGKRDGIDAAQELFESHGIRCIFATAHDDARTRARAEPYAPLGWLAKPYTMGSLIAAVTQALTKLD